MPVTQFKPVLITLEKMLEIIQRLEDDPEKGKQKARQAIRAAIDARARELGISQTEMMKRADVRNIADKDRFLTPQSIRIYSQLGLRPEHFVTFTQDIWYDWPLGQSVRLQGGTHLGLWDKTKERVLSLHDVIGMTDVWAHLQQQVAVNLRISMQIEQPPLLDPGAPELSLTESLSKLQQDCITDAQQAKVAALISFGSPNTCLLTAVLAEHVWPNPEASFPRIVLNHKHNQLLGDRLFLIEKKKPSIRVGSRDRLVSQKPKGKVLEDFALVGMRFTWMKDTSNVDRFLAGFAAGIGHLGTLAASRAIPLLIRHLTGEQNPLLTTIVSTDNQDDAPSKAVIGVVRVCCETGDTEVDHIIQNQRIGAYTTDHFGWNLIHPNELALRPDGS